MGYIYLQKSLMGLIREFSDLIKELNDAPKIYKIPLVSIAVQTSFWIISIFFFKHAFFEKTPTYIVVLLSFYLAVVFYFISAISSYLCFLLGDRMNGIKTNIEVILGAPAFTSSLVIGLLIAIYLNQRDVSFYWFIGFAGILCVAFYLGGIIGALIIWSYRKTKKKNLER